MSAGDDSPTEMVDGAAALPDAASAISYLMEHSPPFPQTVGTAEHDAFLAGKDATITSVLIALRCEHRSGLSGVDPANMLAVGKVVEAVDAALSAKAGVDTHGRALV